MLQEQREEILKLFRRIYQKVSDAEGEAQFVFKDDNQKYLTHALIQSVLYNIEQQCVILFVEEHCLNDGTNATPMSLDSFKECMNTKQTNPMTRQYTMRETYNFYDCVTGTNAFNKTHLAEYRVQFDKAIELLSIDNPNLDALDIPQEVKDALRGLQFPIIKPYTLAEINAITEEESDNLNRLRLNDTNAVLESGKLWLIKLLSSEQIQALKPEQIQALTIEQIKALTTEQIKALRQKAELNSFEQVLNLSEENPYLIRLLTLQEIQALTRDQIQALQPYQIWALEFRQIKSLTQRQIKALETEQIKSLTEIQIKSLTQRQIQALETEQIKALTEIQIKSLTQRQIQVLEPVQIQALEPEQIKFLRENEVLNSLEQVLNLSEENPYLIKLLNLQEIQALTTDQIQVLDIWQIQALEPHQISALEPEQIQALEPEQIKALEPEQIKALKTEQIQALVTNILIQSYNSSIKTLESFQAKLGEYNNITINAEDAKKAFSAIHFVAKGQNFTEDHLKILQDKINWMQFIEQLVTYLFNCFRTEKQESIGGAKGKFQEMINKPKDKIQPQR